MKNITMATITNQAALTYNGITVNSNIVTAELTEALTATKTATVDSYGPGELITYVVDIRNNSGSACGGVTLTDDLGAYTFGTPPAARTLVPLTYTGEPVLYFSGGARQPAPAVTAGPPLIISGITVPANSNALLIYQVQANRFAPPAAGSSIDNTVRITGPCLGESITAESSLDISAEPILSITKSVSPSNITVNDPITYTLTIQNTGAVPADAEDGIVITDIFDPILMPPLTVTLNGAVIPAAGSYRYAVTNGTFSTVPGAITVPAATYVRDPVTGAYTVIPGTAVLTITGTI